MTLALSYLNDLSRVRVALSNRADGTVLVERSATSGFQLSSGTDLAVRGGVELPISGGVGQLDDYNFFADAQNWYRVTPADPPAGLLLTDVSGDYASSPDNAALDITGDIDLRADVTKNDWQEFSYLIAKFGSVGNRSYAMRVETSGLISILWSVDGSGFLSMSSTVAPTVSDGQRLAVRVTLDVNNGAAGRTATFYTAATLAGPWAQLGSPVTVAGTTSIFSSGQILEVGSNTSGTGGLWAGSVHAVEVRSGINGTAVANPDFAAQDNGDTSFVDSAGRTWTVNGNAEIVGVETDSITPSLDGHVWLKSIEYPLLNVVVDVVDYTDPSYLDRNGIFLVEGRSLPTGAGELHGGRDHTLIVASDNAADDAHLDLMARVGRHFFIHVPTASVAGREGNLLLPGSMYVLVGRPVKHRLGGVTEYQHLALPLTEVNPPGPDVTGTTLTWDTIRRVYGDWTNTWAAHSAWRSVWDSIGDPEDLYVP
jgi:hypothetical protein